MVAEASGNSQITQSKKEVAVLLAELEKLKIPKDKEVPPVVVQPSGSGMSESFVRNRLFKPFQSTKAGGMGIGANVDTKTAIAVQLGNLLGTILTSRGKPSKMAEPLAFGVIGLVDVSVNRWLSQPGSDVTSAELAEFLERSIWQVLDGNLRSIGADITLSTPIADL